MALSDFWLFAAPKKHLEGIMCTCDWRSSSCCGKMVLRTSWRILNWQIWKTCSSSVVMLYWTRGTLFGKMRYRNKLCILTYVLCFISLSGCKDTLWSYYFPNNLCKWLLVHSWMQYLFPVTVKTFVVFLH